MGNAPSVPSRNEVENNRPKFALNSRPISKRPPNVVRFIKSAGLQTRYRILVACSPDDRRRWQQICFNFAKRRALCMDVQVDENGKSKEQHLNTNSPHSPDDTTWELLKEHGIEDKTPIYTYRVRTEEEDKDFDWGIETTEHGITERCEFVLMDQEQFFRWSSLLTVDEIDLRDYQMILEALKRDCGCLVGGAGLCVLCYKDEYQGLVLMADQPKPKEGPNVSWFEMNELPTEPWVEWVEPSTEEGKRRLAELTSRGAPLRNGKIYANLLKWHVGDLEAVRGPKSGKHKHLLRMTYNQEEV